MSNILVPNQNNRNNRNNRNLNKEHVHVYVADKCQQYALKPSCEPKHKSEVFKRYALKALKKFYPLFDPRCDPHMIGPTLSTLMIKCDPAPVHEKTKKKRGCSNGPDTLATPKGHVTVVVTPESDDNNTSLAVAFGDSGSQHTSGSRNDGVRTTKYFIDDDTYKLETSVKKSTHIPARGKCNIFYALGDNHCQRVWQLYDLNTLLLNGDVYEDPDFHVQPSVTGVRECDNPNEFCHYIARIPLYDPNNLEECVERQIPVQEIHFQFKCRSKLANLLESIKLKAISIVCHLRPTWKWFGQQRHLMKCNKHGWAKFLPKRQCHRLAAPTTSDYPEPMCHPSIAGPLDRWVTTRPDEISAGPYAPNREIHGFNASAIEESVRRTLSKFVGFTESDTKYYHLTGYYENHRICNVSSSRKVDRDIQYPMSQCTEFFVCVSLLHYISELKYSCGPINLDDPLITLELLRLAGANEVIECLVKIYGDVYGGQVPSVNHLLNHTSGLPECMPLERDTILHILSGESETSTCDFLNTIYRVGPSSLATDKATARICFINWFCSRMAGDVRPLYAPGTKYNHSYLGYIILQFMLPGWDSERGLATICKILTEICEFKENVSSGGGSTSPFSYYPQKKCPPRSSVPTEENIPRQPRAPGWVCTGRKVPLSGSDESIVQCTITSGPPSTTAPVDTSLVHPPNIPGYTVNDFVHVNNLSTYHMAHGAHGLYARVSQVAKLLSLAVQRHGVLGHILEPQTVLHASSRTFTGYTLIHSTFTVNGQPVRVIHGEGHTKLGHSTIMAMCPSLGLSFCAALNCLALPTVSGVNPVCEFIQSVLCELQSKVAETVEILSQDIQIPEHRDALCMSSKRDIYVDEHLAYQPVYSPHYLGYSRYCHSIVNKEVHERQPELDAHFTTDTFVSILPTWVLKGKTHMPVYHVNLGSEPERLVNTVRVVYTTGLRNKIQEHVTSTSGGSLTLDQSAELPDSGYVLIGTYPNGDVDVHLLAYDKHAIRVPTGDPANPTMGIGCYRIIDPHDGLLTERVHFSVETLQEISGDIAHVSKEPILRFMGQIYVRASFWKVLVSYLQPHIRYTNAPVSIHGQQQQQKQKQQQKNEPHNKKNTQLAVVNTHNTRNTNSPIGVQLVGANGIGPFLFGGLAGLMAGALLTRPWGLYPRYYAPYGAPPYYTRAPYYYY